MARFRAKRRRISAGIRIIGGKPVLVTPGLKRIRRRKKRESKIIDRMVAE